jgi:uncharacterized membrane-anchored protein
MYIIMKYILRGTRYFDCCYPCQGFITVFLKDKYGGMEAHYTYTYIYRVYNDAAYRQGM